MSSLIHGVDYLIDYYALLGIEHNAPEGEIKQAYRERIKQYHPDIVARAAPEIQKTAESKSRDLTGAYRILSEPDLRKVYDAQLLAFNGPISRDGAPIIDLTKKRISIDALISGETASGKEALIEKVKMMSGYSETVFNIVKQQYDLNPTEDMKKAYKEMLEKKNIYLCLMETVEWQAAGVDNQQETSSLAYPEDHIKKRMKQVEEVKQAINDSVEKRVTALESGIAPKLLTQGKEYGPEAARGNALAIMHELKEMAHKNFEPCIGGIKALAGERSKVLEEMLKFTEWEYFPAEQRYHDKILVVLTDGNEIKGEILYLMEGNSVTPIPQQNLRGIKVEDFRQDAKTAAQMLSDGVNIALLKRNPELDLLLETAYVMDLHFNNKK